MSIFGKTSCYCDGSDGVNVKSSIRRRYRGAGLKTIVGWAWFAAQSSMSSSGGAGSEWREELSSQIRDNNMSLCKCICEPSPLQIGYEHQRHNVF
jgi:hypothetical protein